MRTLQEMTLQEKLGQRLAAGFQGLEPPEEFLRLIKEYKVGNIILFRRNIQDGPQLKKLCATLRKVVEEETGVTPFITIDQEGGVVTRLPESEVNIPGAMAVAATGSAKRGSLFQIGPCSISSCFLLAVSIIVFLTLSLFHIIINAERTHGKYL